MFNIMMKLRTTKFPSGDSVKARLKSSSSSSPLTATAVVYNPKISTMYASQFISKNGGSNNSRKKRSSNKGRSNNSSSGVNANATNKSKNNQQSGGNASKRRNSKDMTNKQTTPNDGAKTRPKKVALKPPAMGEFNFPSLPPTSDGDSKPFQVEKVDDEMLRNCEKERRSASGFSDSSSTATSSTASTPNGSVAGGYAAALLRPAAPTPVAIKKAVVVKAPTKKAKDNTKKTTKAKEGKTDDKKTTESNFPPAVTVQPPTWGQGRSFADIVSA
jgi:hypothetical protein